MSIKIMSLVWETNIGPATRRLVLLALADSANDEGACWPSLPTLARKEGCAESTAREHCRELEEQGLLHREYRKAENGNNRSNIYWISLERLRAWTPPPESGGALPRELVPEPPLRIVSRTFMGTEPC